MSLIIKGISSLREEWKQLTKKKIKKPKRRNQYTLQYQFDNTLVNNQQKNDLLLAVQKIPKTIPNNNVYRLKTNIQFTIDINKDHSLGSLSIDPHSNNYKISRIDKRKNLLILTLNQINRPITPSEVLFQIFNQRSEELAKSFLQFNARNLDPFKMKQNSVEEMVEYEKKLQGKPYACYVNIYKNNEWVTFQKILSSEMLKVFAISEEMLFHYCNETQLLPFSAYLDHQDDQLNIFYKIFSGIVKQLTQKREYMNYNGEKFTAALVVKCFFIFDEEKNQLFEYTYCLTECEERWMREDRIKQNELDYFNIKPVSSSTEESSYQEPLKRCGFKQLI